MRGKPYSNLLKRKKKLLREKKMKIKFLHFNSTVNLIIYIYRVVKNIIGNPIFVNLNIPRYRIRILFNVPRDTHRYLIESISQCFASK